MFFSTYWHLESSSPCSSLSQLFCRFTMLCNYPLIVTGKSSLHPFALQRTLHDLDNICCRSLTLSITIFSIDHSLYLTFLLFSIMNNFMLKRRDTYTHISRLPFSNRKIVLWQSCRSTIKLHE